jgi:hypothetical protein
MRSTAATAAVLFSAAALSAASLVAAHSSGKHAHPARLEKSDPTKEGVEFSLDKRQASNARFTYYEYVTPPLPLAKPSLWHRTEGPASRGLLS